eukprot:m.39549 g.39549  ORF g.39549 m.39549 type:complete len:2243 (+) comp5568_c0_seq2:1683-8411(+)
MMQYFPGPDPPVFAANMTVSRAIPQYAATGNWTVSFTCYDNSRLSAKSTPTLAFQVTSPSFGPPSVTAISLSRPAVDSSLFSQTSQLNISYVSVPAGIYTCQPVFASYPNESRWQPTVGSFSQIAGNATQGTLSYQAYVERYTPQGTYPLDSIVCTDNAWFQLQLNSTQIASMFPAAAITQTGVVSIEPPHISSVSFSPTAVNTLDSSQTVLMTVIAQDENIVTSCTASFTSPDGSNVVVDLQPIFAGSATFFTQIFIMKNTEPGIWALASLKCLDSATRVTELPEEELAQYYFNQTAGAGPLPAVQLLDFRFNQTTISTSTQAALLTYTFSVFDSAASVTSCTATVSPAPAIIGATSPSYLPPFLGTIYLTVNVDTPRAGMSQLSGTFNLPRFAAGGPWNVSGITCTDTTGATQSFALNKVAFTNTATNGDIRPVVSSYTVDHSYASHPFGAPAIAPFTVQASDSGSGLLYCMMTMSQYFHQYTGIAWPTPGGTAATGYVPFLGSSTLFGEMALVQQPPTCWDRAGRATTYQPPTNATVYFNITAPNTVGQPAILDFALDPMTVDTTNASAMMTLTLTVQSSAPVVCATAIYPATGPTAAGRSFLLRGSPAGPSGVFNLSASMFISQFYPNGPLSPTPIICIDAYGQTASNFFLFFNSQTGRGDTVSPVLTGLTLRSSTTSLSSILSVELALTDDFSGVQMCACTICPSTNANLCQVYSAFGSRFQTSTTLTMNATFSQARGTLYTVTSVQCVDYAGNRLYASAFSLALLTNGANSVPVGSVEPISPVNVTVSPTAVSCNGHNVVSISARFPDPSFTGTCTITWTSPDNSTTLTANAINIGVVAVATVIVPTNSLSGVWTATSASCADALGLSVPLPTSSVSALTLQCRNASAAFSLALVEASEPVAHGSISRSTVCWTVAGSLSGLQSCTATFSPPALSTQSSAVVVGSAALADRKICAVIELGPYPTPGSWLLSQASCMDQSLTVASLTATAGTKITVPAGLSDVTAPALVAFTINPNYISLSSRTQKVPIQVVWVYAEDASGVECCYAGFGSLVGPPTIQVTACVNASLMAGDVLNGAVAAEFSVGIDSPSNLNMYPAYTYCVDAAGRYQPLNYATLPNGIDTIVSIVEDSTMSEFTQMPQPKPAALSIGVGGTTQSGSLRVALGDMIEANLTFPFLYDGLTICELLWVNSNPLLSNLTLPLSQVRGGAAFQWYGRAIMSNCVQGVLNLTSLTCTAPDATFLFDAFDLFAAGAVNAPLVMQCASYINTLKLALPTLSLTSTGAVLLLSITGYEFEPLYSCTVTVAPAQDPASQIVIDLFPSNASTYAGQIKFAADATPGTWLVTGVACTRYLGGLPTPVQPSTYYGMQFTVTAPPAVATLASVQSVSPTAISTVAAAAVVSVLVATANTTAPQACTAVFSSPTSSARLSGTGSICGTTSGIITVPVVFPVGSASGSWALTSVACQDIAGRPVSVSPAYLLGTGFAVQQNGAVAPTPLITAVTISPTQVSVASSSATVAIAVSTDPSATACTVVLISPSGKTVVTTPGVRSTAVQFISSVVIPKLSSFGVWRIANVSCSNTAGTTLYDGVRIATVGIGQGSGVLVTSLGDSDPPYLGRLLGGVPATIDTSLAPATILFNVSASDQAVNGPASGIASYCMTMSYLDTSLAASQPAPITSCISGASSSSLFGTVPITFPVGSPKGKWYLTQIVCTDVAGNVQNLSFPSLYWRLQGAFVNQVGTGDSVAPAVVSSSLPTTVGLGATPFSVGVAEDYSVVSCTAFFDYLASSGCANTSLGTVDLALMDQSLLSFSVLMRATSTVPTGTNRYTLTANITMTSSMPFGSYRLTAITCTDGVGRVATTSGFALNSRLIAFSTAIPIVPINGGDGGGGSSLVFAAAAAGGGIILLLLVIVVLRRRSKRAVSAGPRDQPRMPHADISTIQLLSEGNQELVTLRSLNPGEADAPAYEAAGSTMYSIPAPIDGDAASATYARADPHAGPYVENKLLFGKPYELAGAGRPGQYAEPSLEPDAGYEKAVTLNPEYVPTGGPQYEKPVAFNPGYVPANALPGLVGPTDAPNPKGTLRHRPDTVWDENENGYDRPETKEWGPAYYTGSKTREGTYAQGATPLQAGITYEQPRTVDFRPSLTPGYEAALHDSSGYANTAPSLEDSDGYGQPQTLRSGSSYATGGLVDANPYGFGAPPAPPEDHPYAVPAGIEPAYQVAGLRESETDDYDAYSKAS